MPMEGFFEMTTPAHLLQKLEREYEGMEAGTAPTPDRAWNFFITAEHLPDWLVRTDSQSLGGLKILPDDRHPYLASVPRGWW